MDYYPLQCAARKRRTQHILISWKCLWSEWSLTFPIPLPSHFQSHFLRINAKRCLHLISIIFELKWNYESCMWNEKSIQKSFSVHQRHTFYRCHTLQTLTSIRLMIEYELWMFFHISGTKYDEFLFFSILEHYNLQCDQLEMDYAYIHIIFTKSSHHYLSIFQWRDV